MFIELAAQRLRERMSPEQSSSRRGFLRAIVTGGGALTAISETTTAQENTTAGNGTTTTTGNATTTNQTGDGGTQTNDGGGIVSTFEFGGEVAGWRGRAPASIEGTTNPTLNLETGTQYTVVWENLDGVAHNFTIQDSSGNNLVSTKTMSNQGETLSLTFTASEEMATYICTIHPTTMVGDIQFGGGGGGGAQQRELDPEEMGVPFQAHYVGIATILAVIISLVYTFFVLKYGESSHASSPNRK